MPVERVRDIDMYYEVHGMRRGISNSELVTFRGGHMFFMLRERRWFLDSVNAALGDGHSVRTS